ncbi:ion channel [Methanobacterium paludis]|uniref:Ion transport 2 domain protein n=1 Tax=Methanobacterium paludis (strain DSM 25820 / JCM 18151 / SWAN1) TaxID=868131 RepID=F6D296_METPW|nr:ion channel [Methanobacterium paludis]AEG18613.1 Ion transport 2 domain protein [Methanobacterium paludis]
MSMNIKMDPNNGPKKPKNKKPGILDKITFKMTLDFIVISLIVADIFLLTWSDFSKLSVELTQNIIYFDLMVCFVLFCEFILRFKDAEDKKAFIKDKRNWLDIIAMIPIEFAPLRIIRLLRVIILINKIPIHFKGFVEETHLDWSFGVILITVVSGTIFFYIVEVGVNGNVHNLGDALWYILPTMATDGGNITPDTILGRIISMIVMVIGILFFGMFTASIASWLTKKSGNKDEKEEIHELKNVVKDLQLEIKELRNLAPDLQTDVKESKDLVQDLKSEIIELKGVIRKVNK